MKRNNNIYSGLSLIIILICTLFFQGCNNDRNNELIKGNTTQGDGEIVETKLTDKEKELLQGFDIDKYFMFDSTIKNKNIKYIEFWVDYYEKGIFKDKCFGIGTDIQLPQDENIKLTFSTQKYIPNTSEEKWTFSIVSNGSTSKGSVNIGLSENIQSQSWDNAKASEIIIGKEVNLAVIAGTERNTMSSISVDTLNENDEVIRNKAFEELLKNDHVYILKYKVKEN